MNRKFLVMVMVFLVVVAGGGTGGISAAIQAARMGADVLVVEA